MMSHVFARANQLGTAEADAIFEKLGPPRDPLQFDQSTFRFPCAPFDLEDAFDNAYREGWHGGKTLPRPRGWYGGDPDGAFQNLPFPPPRGLDGGKVRSGTDLSVEIWNLVTSGMLQSESQSEVTKRKLYEYMEENDNALIATFLDGFLARARKLGFDTLKVHRDCFPDSFTWVERSAENMPWPMPQKTVHAKHNIPAASAASKKSDSFGLPDNYGWKGKSVESWLLGNEQEEVDERLFGRHQGSAKNMPRPMPQTTVHAKRNIPAASGMFDEQMPRPMPQTTVHAKREMFDVFGLPDNHGWQGKSVQTWLLGNEQEEVDEQCFRFSASGTFPR